MLVDKHGRLADRLRIGLTDRCDLRCTYCMPLHGNVFAPKSELLTNEEIVRVSRFLVKRTGLTRIRLTGGEPLLHPGLEDLVRDLATLDIEDLAMTTNAQLLADHAEGLARAGLRRVNVSLDTLDSARFDSMARVGKLSRTLEGIDAAIEAGLGPVKLNCVVMRGDNDDEVADLVRYALDRDVELRFLELMSIGEAAAFHGEKFVSSEDTRARLAREFTIEERPFEPGETAHVFGIRNGTRAGSVGFISPVSKPFCTSCRRLRLSGTGVLRGCLMNGAGPDVRAILRSGDADWEEQLARTALTAINQKPWLSTMETQVAMHRLGG